MSVTAAKGFVAAGIACGIKPSGTPDLALVATDDGRPVNTAAVFTTNKISAAPVQVSRAHHSETAGHCGAVILNSGGANAATGDAGMETARMMCERTSAELGCKPSEVLVCSTGLIGFQLPSEAIAAGIPKLVASCAVDGSGDAATAILTTDSERKEVVVEGAGYVIGGMAKGSGMVNPKMATMLCVLTTDADVSQTQLQTALDAAVSETFNRLSIDGCTSTNDTVILMASGRAAKPSLEDFTFGLTQACEALALEIVADAEGATKTVLVNVTGATSDYEGDRAARQVGQSQLVKCSLYGEDPYWGRVLSEIGSAEVTIDVHNISIAYGDQLVVNQGAACERDTEKVRQYLQGRHVSINIDLGMGQGTGKLLTNDLGPAYIEENMRTS